MLNLFKNPLRRDRSNFAPQTRTLGAGIPKSISTKMARDIGMSPSDLARHRFVWPSQSKDRPLI